MFGPTVRGSTRHEFPTSLVFARTKRLVSRAAKEILRVAMMKVRVCFGYFKPWWGIVSKIIRKVEGLPYSHSWLETDSSLVFEAVYPAVHVVSVSEHRKKYELVTFFEFNVNSETFYKSAEEHIGKPFSMLQLVWVGLTYSAKAIAKLLSRNKLNGRRSFICAEFCSIVLETCGIFKVKEQHDSISNRDLLEMCKEAVNDIPKPRD